MLPRFRNSFAAIVIAASASACGGDSTGPAASTLATLDHALTELSNSGVTRPHVMFTSVGAAASTLDPAKCQYAPGSQSFVCSSISANGVTLTPSFTLLSGSGTKQSAFDPASTESVREVTTASGTFVAPGTSLVVNGDQQLTLIAVTSAPHVLTGKSFISLTGSVSNGTSTYPVYATTETTVNLVLPPTAVTSRDAWPTSGTIVMLIDGTLGPLPVNLLRTTITFSGTSTVNVVVSGGGQTQNCQVDLATSDPVCP
jgi:hypothetical protein